MTEPKIHEKPSTFEIIIDHPRYVAWSILGLVSIVALFTQSDASMIRYVLGGCGTLAFLTIFMSS